MVNCAPGGNLMIAGEDSLGGVPKIVKNVVRKRIEERARQVSHTPPKPDRSGFVLVIRDQPNLGYRPVPPAQDDPVTIIQAGDVPGEVSLRLLHGQYGCNHEFMLSLISRLC